MKKLIVGAIIVFLIIIALANSKPKNNLSKIGVIIPLSGPASQIGEEIKDSIELGSTTLSVSRIYEDDQCDSKKAISAYEKLKLEGVRVFYIGCSGSVLSVAPLAKKDGNLILTAYAGSAEIRKTGDEVIRFIPDALSIAEEMAKYVQKTATTTTVLGLLNEQQDYAVSVADALRGKLQGFIKYSDTYSASDTTFRTQIVKMKTNKVNTLLYVPTSDKAEKLVLADMKTLGYSPFIVGDVNFCEYPINPADFGIKSVCFDTGFSSETDGYKKFVNDYKVIYGKDSVSPFYDSITFDVIKIVDGFMKSSKGGDLKSYILKGVRGTISDYTFTPDGEVVSTSYVRKVER